MGVIRRKQNEVHRCMNKLNAVQVQSPGGWQDASRPATR